MAQESLICATTESFRMTLSVPGIFQKTVTVTWLPATILFNRLVAAGKLP